MLLLHLFLEGIVRWLSTLPCHSLCPGYATVGSLVVILHQAMLYMVSSFCAAPRLIPDRLFTNQLLVFVHWLGVAGSSLALFTGQERKLLAVVSLARREQLLAVIANSSLARNGWLSSSLIVHWIGVMFRWCSQVEPLVGTQNEAFKYLVNELLAQGARACLYMGHVHLHCQKTCRSKGYLWLFLKGCGYFWDVFSR